MKILLIDDDLVSLEILKIFLNKPEYEVYAYSDAEEAIDEVRKTNFDLVITDIIMPGMTGIDFIKDMWSHGIRPPIITITAGPENVEGGQEDYVHFGSIFADESLAKPVSKEELLKTIAKLTAPHKNNTELGGAE